MSGFTITHLEPIPQSPPLQPSDHPTTLEANVPLYRYDPWLSPITQPFSTSVGSSKLPPSKLLVRKPPPLEIEEETFKSREIDLGRRDSFEGLGWGGDSRLVRMERQHAEDTPRSSMDSPLRKTSSSTSMSSKRGSFPPTPTELSAATTTTTDSSSYQTFEPLHVLDRPCTPMEGTTSSSKTVTPPPSAGSGSDGPPLSRPQQGRAATLQLLREYSPSLSRFVEQGRGTQDVAETDPGPSQAPTSSVSIPTLSSSHSGRDSSNHSKSTVPTSSRSTLFGMPLVPLDRRRSKPGPWFSLPAIDIQNTHHEPPIEEKVRISGTFGVRDDVSPSVKRDPIDIKEQEGPSRLPTERGRLSPVAWGARASSEELTRPPTPNVPERSTSHQVTVQDSESEDQDKDTLRAPVIEQDRHTLQNHRHSFIDGASIARPDRAECGEQPSTSHLNKEVLRDVFRDSVRLAEENSPSAGATVFRHQSLGPPPTGRRREASREGMVSTPLRRSSPRLPSLTESHIGEEELAEIRHVEEQHRKPQRPQQAGDERIPSPRPSSGGSPPRPGHTRRAHSLGGEQYRLSQIDRGDIPLLLASSMLSQHAAVMLETFTEGKTRAAQLKTMAEESLEAGRILLDLANRANSDQSNSAGCSLEMEDLTPLEQERANRQVAYDSLVAAQPPRQPRREAPLPPVTIPYTARQATASSQRPALRNRRRSLPSEVLSDVERLGQAGWDRMREAEFAWREMIIVLKRNLEEDGRRSSASASSSLQRTPSKIAKRRSSSPNLAQRIIKRAPGISPSSSLRRASREVNPTKANQQVRFSDERPKRNWFGFMRKSKKSYLLQALGTATNFTPRFSGSGIHVSRYILFSNPTN